MVVKVKVTDALCGQGKTKRMMDTMAAMPLDEKIIYITPLLSETHRIAGTSYDKNDVKKKVIKDNGLYVYDAFHPLINRRFRHPESQQGDGKVGGLQHLVRQNENIVATHALFQMLTPEIVQEIKERGYHLFMDEVLDVWNVWDTDENNLKPKEVAALLDNGTLSKLEDGITLAFNHDKFGNVEETNYKELAAICDLQQLLYLNNTVIWQMPFPALAAFKSISVGTYLYEGSLLSAYFKHFGAEVEVEYFGKKPSQIKHLVKIIEHEKMNAVGEKDNALSYTSLTKKRKERDELHEKLANNLKNLYKGRSADFPKSRQADRLWTTPKDVKDKIGTTFKVAWLASTTKATNDYSDRWYLAYLLEKNQKPPIVVLLKNLGVSINQDMYALSEIVQWVWRSRIRNEQEIYLYMPSKRMRHLFKAWLDDEYDARPCEIEAFVPTTNPFYPNGDLCKLWHTAALKAGVNNKDSWEQFREKYLALAKQKGIELNLTADTVPMTWK